MCSILLFAMTYFSCNETKDYGEGFKQQKNHPSLYSDDYEYPISNKEAYIFNEKALDKINSNKFNKALKLFQKANELEPDNPSILSNIGNVYQRQVIYGQAEEYYNRSIEVSDSNYLPAIVNLSSLFMDKEEYEKSIKLSETLLGKFEEPKYQAGLFFNLLIAHSKVGNCKSALIYYKELKMRVKITGQYFFEEKAMKYLKDCDY